jgi:hypothetical protein
MCDKCDQIENKIQQFRRLATPGMDRLSLAMMRSAIESLEADRAALKCKSIPTRSADEAESQPRRRR